MPTPRRGRPRTTGGTMLSPELADSLVLSVRQRRVFDSQIAIAHGIHPHTLRDWIRRGLEQGAGEPWRSFAERYTKEQIADEEDAVAELRECAKPFQGKDKFSKPGDWRAAAWYLERKYPKRWALEKQNPGGPAEAIDIENILRETTEQADNLKELLTNPPAELAEAMIEAKDAIRAFLDAARDDELATVSGAVEADSSCANEQDEETTPEDIEE